MAHAGVQAPVAAVGGREPIIRPCAASIGTSSYSVRGATSGIGNIAVVRIPFRQAWLKVKWCDLIPEATGVCALVERRVLSSATSATSHHQVRVRRMDRNAGSGITWFQSPCSTPIIAAKQPPVSRSDKRHHTGRARGRNSKRYDCTVFFPRTITEGAKDRPILELPAKRRIIGPCRCSARHQPREQQDAQLP